MKESELQKQVNKILRQIPGLWFYHPRETQKGTDGIPDLIICYRGKFLAIELKNPDLKDPAKGLRKEQAKVLDAIKKAGGKVLVANSLDEVIDFISKIK